MTTYAATGGREGFFGVVTGGVVESLTLDTGALIKPAKRTGFRGLRHESWDSGLGCMLCALGCGWQGLGLRRGV